MVAYDPKFLSKEEIAEINGDKSDIELIEHDLQSQDFYSGSSNSNL